MRRSAARCLILAVAIGSARLARASVLAAAAPPDTSLHRATVAHSSSGVFFYRGNELHPPYTFEATFRVSPDTIWIASYVNGLTLLDRSSELAFEEDMKRDSVSKYGRRNWVLNHAGDIVRAHPLPSERDEEFVRLMSRANQDVPVVDSIESLGPHSARVLWHGAQRWEHVEIPLSVERRREDAPLSLARNIADGLGPGRVTILASRGELIVVGLDIIASIDSLRANQAVVSPMLSSPEVVADFRHPFPLPSAGGK